MLRSCRVLPPGFDDVNNDQFDIAPFTAAAFRPHMRKVFSYGWRHLDNETCEVWNYGAAALNDRPVVGLFCQFPQILLQGSDKNTGAALKNTTERLFDSAFTAGFIVQEG